MSANAAPPHTLLAWVYGTDKSAPNWLGSRPGDHTVELVLEYSSCVHWYEWFDDLRERYGRRAVRRKDPPVRPGLRGMANETWERAPTLRAER
jgi:hypothetical protein